MPNPAAATKCQEIASPSRSGSVARYTALADFAPSFISFSTFFLPWATTYLGEKSLSDIYAELFLGEVAHMAQ